MNNIITFKASRKKAILILIGSLCFVALGVFTPLEKPWVGWLCAAFFSLGVPASFLMLLPNAMYLRLDEEGFEMGSPFGKQKIKWDDVSSFSIGSVRGAKMIAITFSQQYKQQKFGRAVSASLSGMEGAIANSYDASLDEVLMSLKKWKERFGRGTK